MSAEIGSAAPSFTLKDQKEGEITLSTLKGKKVVLSFHPLAWTEFCKLQMQDLEKHKAEFDRMNAVALGFSVDSMPSKKAWAEAIGVKETSIVADFWPHGGVAQAYGLFRDQNGFSERAVVLVDDQGTVRWKKVYPIKSVPDITEILSEVEKL